MILGTERKIIIKAITVCTETPSASHKRLQLFRDQTPLPGSDRAQLLHISPLISPRSLSTREKTDMLFTETSVKFGPLELIFTPRGCPLLTPGGCLLRFCIFAILFLFPTFFFFLPLKKSQTNKQQTKQKNTTGKPPPCARDMRTGNSSRWVLISEAFLGDFFLCQRLSASPGPECCFPVGQCPINLEIQSREAGAAGGHCCSGDHSGSGPAMSRWWPQFLELMARLISLASQAKSAQWKLLQAEPPCTPGKGRVRPAPPYSTSSHLLA